MSDPGKAVFLSYASQDSDAAKKICDALRAAGVEVWFDQSELAGGDAWDAKIRRQIAECALFVPIISANTQARLEGYFRIEWKLAAQRTHAMADEKAFLLPVVIDATADASARVPAEFKSVQWTRLPQAAHAAAFGHRVRKVLDATESPASEASTPTAEPAVREIRRQRSSPLPLVLTVAGVVAAAGLALWRPWRHATPVAAVAPATAVPLSEAKQLVAKARALALHDQWDEVTREDFALAERLLNRALELDPTDGEAWAAAALVSAGQIASRYDYSQSRRELVRTQADRAIKLAPDSTQAMFARAFSYRYQQAATETEALRLHRELVVREPGNKWFWRQLGRVLEVVGGKENTEEALQCYERAIALPGGDPTALRLKADMLAITFGRTREAEAALDAALALRPTAGHLYASKIGLLLRARPDLTEARQLAARIPPGYLLDDLGAYSAARVWLWSRQPEECLKVLVGLPHDYLDCRYFTGPKTYLTGMAHGLAGRTEAARAEWRIALQRVEQRLAAEPGSPIWLRWRAELLALLGEKAAAEEALRVFEQLTRAQTVSDETGPIYLLLGRDDAVFEAWERLLGDNRANVQDLLSTLRFDLRLDRLRELPRFRALLQKAEVVTRERVEAAASPDSRGPRESADFAPAKSVAVLAFANLSDDKDNEYFSDGISEELLNVLAKVPGLKVSARTSAFSFKGKGVAIPEIARQLGVAYVVEGSVRKAGNRVRITAQLIKARDGFHVWSDNFDRELKDIFAVQDEIAGLIARNLQLTLGTGGQLARNVNPAAYELYLRGRQAWNRRDTAGYERAETLFQQAIDLDPGFARGYVGLVDARKLSRVETGRLGPWSARNSEDLAGMRRDLEKALTIEPDLAEAHTSLGGVYESMWNFPEAEREYRRGVALNPSYATGHHWLGLNLFSQAKIGEGLGELRRAAELDPLSLPIAGALSGLLRREHRLPEALVFADRALGLQPDSMRAIAGKAAVLVDLDRVAEARPLAQRLMQSPEGRNWGQTILVLVRTGLRAEAAELTQEYFRSGDEAMAAVGLAALGRWDEFFVLWEKRPLIAGTGRGTVLLYSEPEFDPVRDDPRFLRGLQDVGLEAVYARARAWSAANQGAEGGGPASAPAELRRGEQRTDKSGSAK